MQTIPDVFPIKIIGSVLPNHFISGAKCLQLAGTSGNSQLSAQDESGLVRQQKGHVSGNLIGCADAPERVLRRHRTLDYLRIHANLSQSWGVNGTRVDDIHADLSGQKVSREGLREGINGRFGGGINTGSWIASVGNNTAVQHN